MKQAELARRVGIDRQALWKIEHNQRAVRADELPAFVRELDLTAEQILGQKPLHGLAESEAVFIHEPEMSDTELRLARLLYPQGQADTMIVGAPSLILEGYAPGDRILVDQNRAPEIGDAVVVQVRDDETDTAETVLRCYRPPMLMPAAVEPIRFEPFLVEDSRVTVMGVIVNRYRPPEDRAA